LNLSFKSQNKRVKNKRVRVKLNTEQIQPDRSVVNFTLTPFIRCLEDNS
jgi:hypothetical protein